LYESSSVNEQREKDQNRNATPDASCLLFPTSPSSRPERKKKKAKRTCKAAVSEHTNHTTPIVTPKKNWSASPVRSVGVLPGSDSLSSLSLGSLETARSSCSVPLTLGDPFVLVHFTLRDRQLSQACLWEVERTERKMSSRLKGKKGSKRTPSEEESKELLVRARFFFSRRGVGDEWIGSEVCGRMYVRVGRRKRKEGRKDDSWRWMETSSNSRRSVS